MISNTLFITYTIMCFLGLQAFTLVMIMIKHNTAGKTRQLKTALAFVIVSFILGLFYYITYYRELILGQFAAGPFLRGLDAVIFYAMGYSWIKLMDVIIDSQNPKLMWWRKKVSGVFFILMGISAAAYIFLLDQYYHTDHLWAEIMVIVLEIILGLTVVVFSLVFLVIGGKEIKDKAKKRYLVFVSIFVNFNNLWNNIVVIVVFLKAMELSAWCSKLYGITSVLLLAINFLTLLFIYKNDFSPTYFENSGQKHKHLTEEEALALNAETYKLTGRERDVMILAYRGKTNPDIADELFISKHTVKRHMHNIFEKLDVSTRMELVHFINDQIDKN